MKNFKLTFITSLLILFTIVQLGLTKEKAGKQTFTSKEVKINDEVICPVLGKELKIKKNSKYADIDSKKYYVCCSDCVKKIKKDPDKYLKDEVQNYKSKELKIGDTTVCLVMGTKFTVKKDTKFAEINGKKIYVCCSDCIEKIKNNPDKYLKPTYHKEKDKHKKSKHQTEEDSHKGNERKHH